MIRTRATACLVASALAIACSAPIAGIPLPSDVRITTSPTINPSYARFYGKWYGKVEGRGADASVIPHVLVVESINNNGTASVIEAWDKNTWWGRGQPAYYRRQGQIAGDTLTVTFGDGATGYYRLISNDKIILSHERPTRGPMFATMVRIDPAEITSIMPPGRAQQRPADSTTIAKLAGTYIGDLAPPRDGMDKNPPGRILIISAAGEGLYGTTSEKPYPVPLTITTEGAAVLVRLTTGVGSDVRLRLDGDTLNGTLTPYGGGVDRALKLKKQ